MPRRRLIAAVAVVASIVACTATDEDSREPSATDAPRPPASDGGRVLRDIDVGGSPADLFLPPDTGTDGDAPVVMMLHGTEGDRSHMEPLAEAVAEDGALVYVPTWPVIDQVAAFPEDQGDEPFRAQSEAVVCALRHIRRTASEHGGDPGDLTVVGHSGGGMIGARVSIVADPPWPGIDCDSDVDHRPTRFIGLAGDYEGWYQYAQQRRDLYAPYDVLTLEPTNVDVEVWLLHGHNDDAVNVSSSGLLQDRLRDAGIDAQLLTTDSTHAALVDTATPAGRFTADRISSIVHGVPEEVWWPPGPIDATLSFGADDTCSYEGPATWPSDLAMTIRFANRALHDTSFALVSIRTDADPSVEEVLAGEGELGVDDPDWVDWGGFRRVPPGESRTMRFAFVEADQRFVLYCHPEHWTDHPRANWMYPAALLAPQELGPLGGSTTTVPASSAEDVPSARVVYLVGDSVTAMHGGTIVSGLDDCGWVVRLHSLSSRRIDLGYVWHDRWVSSGVDEITRILVSGDPDTWLFQLGSNDLQDLRSVEQAHGLIDAALGRIDPDDRVLWTTVLWRGYDDAADLFNQALRETPGIELVDWDTVGRDLLADAVHPTHLGAVLLTDLYCEALSTGDAPTG